MQTTPNNSETLRQISIKATLYGVWQGSAQNGLFGGTRKEIYVRTATKDLRQITPEATAGRQDAYVAMPAPYVSSSI